MTILFTTYQGGVAGSTYSLFELATELKDRGHTIHFAGRPSTPLFELLHKTGILCHAVSFSSYFDFRSVYRLHGIILKYRIELVNAQSGIDRTSLIWCRLFLRTKVKVVFTRRQLPIDEPWIKRQLHMKYADQMVVTSLAIRDSLIQKGYRASQIAVIPNGINPDLFDGILKAEQRDESEIVIGCVSRLKRQDLLIDALPLLPANWTILFVGINQRDILIPVRVKQKLIFKGRISREEALHYYKCMDVHLLLSDAEGFGKTLLEAMLAGVPNVASQVGGIQEVIQSGVNGILVKNDSQELAKSLLKLVGDQELYDLIVREGRRTAVEIFPLEKTVDKFEALFQTIIESK